MIRYLTQVEIEALHAEAIRLHGGIAGIRDVGMVLSAVAQPRMSFGGVDLYPELADKAGALAYSLITNHGFLDGNKRVGFAALDVMLRLNGYRIPDGLADVESVVLTVASGSMSRDEFTEWIRENMVPLSVKCDGP